MKLNWNGAFESSNTVKHKSPLKDSPGDIDPIVQMRELISKVPLASCEEEYSRPSGILSSFTITSSATTPDVFFTCSTGTHRVCPVKIIPTS
jgi:hypothetical protein